MHRNRLALAVLVTASLIATGCGSDDSEPEAEKKSTKSAQAETTESTAKPKTKGARAQMVDCIETELGFDVKPEDDPDSLAVRSDDDKLQAVIVIHNDAGAAQKALSRTLGEKELNAVVFGRAEFIRHGADDTESGVIANCVAGQYNRPRSG